jgi:hypothetical protein
MDTKGYYQDQLKRVSKRSSDFDSRKIKITNDSDNTNWLDLNHESATELVRFLRENYTIDETDLQNK